MPEQRNYRVQGNTENEGLINRLRGVFWYSELEKNRLFGDFFLRKP